MRHPLILGIGFLFGAAGCGAVTKNNGNGGADGSSGLCTGAQTDCGGSCVDLAHDSANCGGCALGCAGSTQCCEGSCSTSCDLAVSGAQASAGWQNGGEFITLRGVGFARGMKVFIGDGRAPARVVDAQTARVMTPPGPLGAADIRVVLGANIAVRRNGFTYQRGALATPW